MLEAFIFATVFNTVMFLIAFNFKTDKLTDISYALTFAAIAAYQVLSNDVELAQAVMAGLVFVWSLRLGSYLLYRIHAMGRDTRFDEMRNNFKKFGTFWLLQGVTAWVLLMPLHLVVQYQIAEITAAYWLAASLMMGSLLFEATADWQKFRFIQNKENKGKWIASGLWKYSRHPNYFGEIMVWCSFWLMSATLLNENGLRFAGIISPIFIAFFLITKTGLPPLEKSADKKWGKNKDYQEYKRRTSILVPLPLKK